MPNPFDPGYYSSEELRSFGFASVGENVLISKSCNIPRYDNIEIGENVRIDAFVSIIAVSGYLRLGSHIHIGIGCMLGCRGGVEMADFTGLSHGVIVLSASDDFSGRHLMNSLVPAEYTNPKVAPVRLHGHSAVGAASVVFPGVEIGEGSVVGGLSLVTKSLDPWGVYFGVPAKRLKSRSRDLLKLEAELRKRCSGQAV